VLERGNHGASRETKRERNGGLVPRQPSPEHHGVEQEIELQGLGWVFSASAEEGGVVCEFCGGRRGELGCPVFKRERGWLTVNRARARGGEGTAARDWPGWAVALRVLVVALGFGGKRASGVLGNRRDGKGRASPRLVRRNASGKRGHGRAEGEGESRAAHVSEVPALSFASHGRPQAPARGLTNGRRVRARGDVCGHHRSWQGGSVRGRLTDHAKEKGRVAGRRR
jgi:hypothetical protein